MEMIGYLAKANLYLVLFYGCYWLLFSRHTFFQWNRFYLLASIIASFLLPLITFYIPAPELILDNTTVSSGPATASEMPARAFDWNTLLLAAYFAGMLLMISRLILSFAKVFRVANKSVRIEMDKYTLFLLPAPDRKTGSFSFFKWAVVSQEDYETNLDTILRHEEVHIRQWHSVDILLIELLKIIFWINPVVWLYKNAIQLVHEYLADECAANRDRYANLLVSYALQVPEQLLANHFYNPSLLKNRIKMIYKNRTSKWMRMKYALIFPLMFVTVFLTASRQYLPVAETVTAVSELLFSVSGKVTDSKGTAIPGATIVVKNGTRGAVTDKNGHFVLDDIPANASIVATYVGYRGAEMEVSATQKSYHFTLQAESKPLKTDLAEPKTGNNPAAPKPDNSHTSAFKVVEDNPQFPGGHEAMVKYLRDNMKYPETARKIKMEGVVIVSFRVDPDGQIGNVVIVKGVGYGLDAESVRLVKNMPKWKPAIQNGEAVATVQTIEIKFDLAAVKANKAQGFVLPDNDQKTWAVNFRVAPFEIDDLLQDPFSFLDDKKIKPSATPPKADYRYVPDSSSYRFMNYNTGWINKDESRFGLTTTGAMQYKHQKQSSDN